MSRRVHIERQSVCLCCVVLTRCALTATFATGGAFATALRAPFTARCLVASFAVAICAGFFATLFTRHAFVAGFAAGLGLGFWAAVV